MKYKSIYSISFDAEDDASALTIANMHHEQVRDGLQVEGADHPHAITLEQLLEFGPAARSVLRAPTTRPI